MTTTAQTTSPDTAAAVRVLWAAGAAGSFPSATLDGVADADQFHAGTVRVHVDSDNESVTVFRFDTLPSGRPGLGLLAEQATLRGKSRLAVAIAVAAAYLNA